MRSERLREFIETVCEQVKAKKAHGLIGSELIAHIEDQKLAYIKEGMNETAAENKAIDDMGDPVEVGEQFNQIHGSKIIWLDLIGNIIMWGISGGIMAIGIIFGIGLLISLFVTGNYIIGLIIGGGVISFGIIITIAFMVPCKIIANKLFYYSLLVDYKRRKKRGLLYGYKKH